MEDNFFKEKIIKIFTEKKEIIDIGGGLRISKTKSNKYEPNREWILPYLDKVNYKVLDPVPDYNPDILGDIHSLPFADNSIDAITCMAVLEHVKNPLKASEEMYRVLKPGGYCFVYIPFLYCYHAMPGYYPDYWRFTSDSIELMFEKFSVIEKRNVRGAIETILKITPFGRYALFQKAAKTADKLLGKSHSQQTSAHVVFLVK